MTYRHNDSHSRCHTRCQGGECRRSCDVIKATNNHNRECRGYHCRDTHGLYVRDVSSERWGHETFTHAGWGHPDKKLKHG